LELQYDPLTITDVIVAPGAFFATPDVLLNQIDSTTGRISYAFGSSLTQGGITGAGTVATITFSAIKVPEQTAIIFLPKTLVTAEGINESILKQTTNGLFTIEANLSSPSAK
jgi:hypothetical protein